uniref:EF-hand domain-containing protein n=1 Tax=Romanomermis culicivorax TaxID=13658 RepID=A0A915HQK5_ROMCU
MNSVYIQQSNNEGGASDFDEQANVMQVDHDGNINADEFGIIGNILRDSLQGERQEGDFSTSAPTQHQKLKLIRLPFNQGQKRGNISQKLEIKMKQEKEPKTTKAKN